MKAACSSLLIALIIALAVLPSYGQAITPVRDDFDRILLDNISKKDIPKLIDFLGQHSPICIYAGRALVELGPDSVPALLVELGKGRLTERILSVLVQIPDKKAVDGLVAIIKDPSAPPVPVSTLAAYGDMAVPALAGLLADEKHGDAAAEALSGISPNDESIRLLRQCLRGADAQERGRAALVLGRWHDAQSGPEVEKLLFNNDITVTKDAVNGYSSIYQAPERYNLILLEKLVEGEKVFDIRQSAVDIIRRVPGKAAGDTLLRIANSEKDNRVLSRVLYAIGDNGDTMMTVPVLNLIQENDDPDVRAAGLYALGKFRAEEAEPYINRIMHNAKKMNPEMKRQAFEALIRIGKPVDFRDYLVHLYDTDGCDECQSFKDILLDLVKANVKPGDKDTLAFMMSFKEKAAPRFQGPIQNIINKINQ